jgi:chaperone BCS1
MAQSNGVPDEYASAPEGDEPLVVMCLGRSVKPIKRFLETCRDFAERQRDAYVTVRSSKMIQFHQAWDTMILRPIRPLDTVHLDEVVKANLVNDIRNYLDNKTKRFYENRGIPYRRGYLLYGPPGTGKTSLSLALAGLFGLELYLLHIPGVREDSELEKLFTTLPPKCLVLLEDIDAIGTARQLDIDDGVEDEEYAKISGEKKQRCTLSGLLNVLDGVSSQEGRVVLMTSNVAHKLDKALIRPGRIDRMVYLGYINEKSASLMYLRMFERDDNQKLENDGPDEVELQKLAIKFSSNVPEETFTPAQLQGFLLNHRESPELAVSEISTWVSEEITKMKDAKEHANQVAALRAKRRTGHMLQVLGQSIAVSNEDSSKNRDEIVLDATLGAQKKSSGGTTKG